MKKIKVSVILLNWNGLDLLKKYFHSLLNQEFENFEIIFFDNNSKDDSINYIKKFKSTKKYKLRIYKNSKNDGTAKASNLAAKYAKGEYIFFVSNDMLFDRKLLKHLYDYMKNKKEIGIATVKMLRHVNDKKTNIIDSMGANIDFLCCASSINIHKNIKNVIDSNKEIFFAFGGATFIKKEIFNKARGYDERFFTLTDDIDLCWRVQILGYKVYYINKGKIFHRVSGTLGKTHNRHIKRFFSERNNLCSMIKNYNLISLFFTIPIYLLLSILETIFFIIILNFKMCLVPIKSIVWNVKNIKVTIKKRNYVQNNRNKNDIMIFKNIHLLPMKIIYGFEFLFRRKYWKNYLN